MKKETSPSQEISFTSFADCNHLGHCLCCTECQYGLHRRIYISIQSASLIGSLTLLPVILASQQAKICQKKKTDHSEHRPTAEDPDHGRYLLWHHSLPGK